MEKGRLPFELDASVARWERLAALAGCLGLLGAAGERLRGTYGRGDGA